jgi:hypothetical protein
VFRPTFVFDTTNGVYQSKLELINIDSVSANKVYTFAAEVGDASGNVYVGIGSGNPHSTLITNSNSNDTFIGKEAGVGTSNVRNSVIIGYYAGANASASSNTVSIGANAKIGGNSNVFIGYGAGTLVGSNNIFIGPGVTNNGSSANNKLLIGSGATTSFMVGDLVNNRLGLNLSTLPTALTPNITLTVNGYSRVGGTTNNGGLGINTNPGNGFTLDVNGNQRTDDGVGVLTFSNGIQSSTGGYFSSNGITGASTTTTVPFKKGMFMLSATSNTTRHGIIGVASSTTAYTVVSQGSNGTLITANEVNLVVSSGTVGWTITYFPMP